VALVSWEKVSLSLNGIIALGAGTFQINTEETVSLLNSSRIRLPGTARTYQNSEPLPELSAKDNLLLGLHRCISLRELIEKIVKGKMSVHTERSEGIV
jgi:ABC-type branched-subunit amino acid transport system ATPase component